MAEVRDLRGQRFGRLRVPARAEYEIRNGKTYWPAICDCGAKLSVRSSKLTGKNSNNKQVSCGCARADPGVRRAARWKVKEQRRKEIAAMGGAASKGK